MPASGYPHRRREVRDATSGGSAHAASPARRRRALWQLTVPFHGCVVLHRTIIYSRYFLRKAPQINISLLPGLAQEGRFRSGPVDVRAERNPSHPGLSGTWSACADRYAGRRRRLRRPRVQLAKVRWGIDGVAIEACNGSHLELACGGRFECGAFERFLADCESVVVFALTAGSAIDRRIEELMAAEDLLAALMLDTAGWLAVGIGDAPVLRAAQGGL